mmetsp:Transcript_103972/g.294583  ORF Transcript_103972/g.294583 Transcript_103972/m.294583 type:complete len:259 (-) Transcript_103972:63-839(-)
MAPCGLGAKLAVVAIVAHEGRCVQVGHTGHCYRRFEDLRQVLRQDGFRGIPHDCETTEKAESCAIEAEFNWLERLTAKELRKRDRLEKATPFRVCQSGFNYGASAYAFLCAGNVAVHSFDEAYWPYVRRASEIVDVRFPGRHTLTVGDSGATVPAAAAVLPPGYCDMVLVDGGHETEEVFNDIVNFRPLTKPGALVLVADCDAPPGRQRRLAAANATVPPVAVAYQRAVSDGLIRLSSKARYFGSFPEIRNVCPCRYA